MTRQNIGIGTLANDGTGDTLRSAGEKINENFIELYLKLGGDSDMLSAGMAFTTGSIVFEGSSLDSYQTSLIVANPTKDNIITLPDSTGDVVITTAEQNLYRKHLYNTKLDGDVRLHSVSGTGYYKLNYLGVVDSGEDLYLNIPDLLDSDTFVFNKNSATLTNKTLTSPSLVTPRVTTSIDDVNGAELIKVTATSSAVNEITVTNAATGGKPVISATGSDTNITLSVTGKGTGSVEIGKVAYTSSTITTAGAASTSATYIICNSGSALAVSLANGTVVGESKIFTNRGAGIATITPATFANGTTVALDQYDSVSLIWDGVRWYITGHYGATVA